MKIAKIHHKKASTTRKMVKKVAVKSNAIKPKVKTGRMTNCK